MAWVLPLVTGALSLAFAAIVARKHALKRRPQDLAWSLGLGAYALTSLIEAWVSANPWTPGLYRVYFPLSAALVGALGAGTAYLVAPRRALPLAHGLAAFLVACAALSAVAQFHTPFDPAAPAPVAAPDGATADVPTASDPGPELGAKAIPWSNPARWANLALNVVGGSVLIGGALWSFARARHPGTLLIGVGGLIPLLAGSLSTLDVANLRVLAQFLGMAAIFAGFLALERLPARSPAPAARKVTP